MPQSLICSSKQFTLVFYTHIKLFSHIVCVKPACECVHAFGRQVSRDQSIGVFGT